MSEHLFNSFLGFQVGSNIFFNVDIINVWCLLLYDPKTATVAITDTLLLTLPLNEPDDVAAAALNSKPRYTY